MSEIETDIDGTREEVNDALKDLEAIKTQAEASINQAINVARLTAAKEHAIENVNQFDVTFTKSHQQSFLLIKLLQLKKMKLMQILLLQHKKKKRLFKMLKNN